MVFSTGVGKLNDSVKLQEAEMSSYVATDQIICYDRFGNPPWREWSFPSSTQYCEQGAIVGHSSRFYGIVVNP
jgi:hypothetical protein